MKILIQHSTDLSSPFSQEKDHQYCNNARATQICKISHPVILLKVPLENCIGKSPTLDDYERVCQSFCHHTPI